MSNIDTEPRTKKFAEYFAKAHQGWTNIIQKYYPSEVIQDTAEHANYLQVAKSYPNPHEWTGLRGKTRSMVVERDSYEVDSQGKPTNCEFEYEVLYKWASYFVHVTVSCLESHFVEAGVTFQVYAGKELDRQFGDNALVNVVAYLTKTFIAGFRALRQDPPGDILNELHELLASYNE
jgi:hypothetical protein